MYISTEIQPTEDQLSIKNPLVIYQILFCLRSKVYMIWQVKPYNLGQYGLLRKSSFARYILYSLVNLHLVQEAPTTTTNCNRRFFFVYIILLRKLRVLKIFQNLSLEKFSITELGLHYFLQIFAKSPTFLFSPSNNHIQTAGSLDH